jgi:hypothetical protein
MYKTQKMKTSKQQTGTRALVYFLSGKRGSSSRKEIITTTTTKTRKANKHATHVTTLVQKTCNK